MKPAFLFFGFILSLTPCFSQLKEIPISKVNQLRNTQLICLDSNNVTSKLCSLDLDGLKINFFNAHFDKTKKSLQLIGRICASESKNCHGISQIRIFTAKKVGNKLSDLTTVGETTEDKIFISNNGFFDIVITINKGESLFFYNSAYFLKEFAISKMLVW